MRCSSDVTSDCMHCAVGCAKAAEVGDGWNSPWPPPVKEEGQVVSNSSPPLQHDAVSVRVKNMKLFGMNMS